MAKPTLHEALYGQVLESRDIVAITGLPARTVVNWSSPRIGLVTPYHKQPSGPGSRRLYSFHNAIELAIARFREFMALWKDNQHLRRALEGRKRIERAKGLLMARQGITEAEAFHSIQRQSMKTRTPMEQVAEAILVAEAVEEVVRPRSKNTQERLLTIKGGNQPTSL